MKKPIQTCLLWLLISCGIAHLAVAQRNNMVLVEAESFHEPGGWFVDAQFMDQMGSPYMLAHGIGVPVKDAKTTVTFPATGSYRVFVRTKDWVSPHGPGKFQVLIDDLPLPETFGTKGGGQWYWHDAGTVNVKTKQAQLTLRDMSGFDGRCDAILFVRQAKKGLSPPNDLVGMEPFRRSILGFPDKPIDQGDFDLVVVGGGFAGICAAVAAGRLGLKAALIQNRPVLGGNSSSEIKVNPIGELFPAEGPYPRNADIVQELLAMEVQMAHSDLKAMDEKRLQVVQAEPNVKVFLNTHARRVEMNNGRVAAIVARNTMTGEDIRFRGQWFVDCTGDGTIGYLAGADFRMGREGRKETGESLAPEIGDAESGDTLLMGNSQYWYAAQHYEPTTFPSCPWALPITEESYEVPTPKWPQKLKPGVIAAGGWNWESGFRQNTITEAEQIRDHILRAVYGMWDYLKNKSPRKDEYRMGKLSWVAHVVGKRESRRLLGDVILKQQDIQEQIPYPDACVTTTWYFDLHFPHPENSKHFPGQEFRSIAYDDPNWEKYRPPGIPGQYTKIKPYAIPYRCFYSRNVPNLFMAGRDISVTHVALTSVRVMKTTAMMGTVVGRAAYICKKHKCDPRQVYTDHLDEFKELLKNPDMLKKAE